MKYKIKEFKYKKDYYNLRKGETKFTSRYDKDFHLFIIWAKGRHYQDNIIDELNMAFNIIDIFNVSWSKNFINNNFCRFFGIRIQEEPPIKQIVGKSDFIVIIIEDKNPIYQYRFNFSNNFKIVNSNIVDIKNKYRTLIGQSEVLHSTDNLSEFFNNSILLFGKEKTYNFFKISKWNGRINNYTYDLIASLGWNNIEELFDILNITQEYVVLDKLSSIFNKSTIILCANKKEFITISNAQRLSDSYYHIIINKKKSLFYLQSFDDNTFDLKWQLDILSKKVSSLNNMYILRKDDYNFLKLYYYFLYKKGDDNLDSEKFIFFSDKINVNMDKKELLKVLYGYMKSNNYQLVLPRNNIYLNTYYYSIIQQQLKS